MNGYALLFQTTLCYYDLRDALALDPLLSQATALMDELKARAKESKRIASLLTIEVRK